MIARAIEKSENRKLGDASTTYASQVSCPTSCPFLHNGCYAETGPVAWSMTSKLNRAKIGPELVAQHEALAIAGLSGRRPLRLHTVGDCKTASTARRIANAAAAYSAKHGQVVWTYTHAWRTVPRAAWDQVSVLASCETISDARAAMVQGYAASMVAEFQNGDHAWNENGVLLIPCPAQTGRAKSCTDCRLCFDDTALRHRHAVIAFEPHGVKKQRVSNVIAKLNCTERIAA